MELGVGLSNTSSTKRNPENGLFISYPTSYDLERHREVYERVCIGFVKFALGTFPRLLRSFEELRGTSNKCKGKSNNRNT